MMVVIQALTQGRSEDVKDEAAVVVQTDMWGNPVGDPVNQE